MEFAKGHTVGIDLGTTFSCIARLDEEGVPVPLPNEDDEAETPSLIVLAESGHVIVGPNRSRAAVEDPQNVVERIKRDMGNPTYKRVFDGNEITPEFISGLILKKLVQDAERLIGKIGNAVITVPYYFNDARRKATEDAGRIAGLNVIGIINEPTAATLTYAWKRGELGAVLPEDKRSRLVLVYDLGGGTFDVTVVRYTPTHFTVLATDGDVQLGGIDWNERLVEHMADVFKQKHGTDPRQSEATRQLLRFECDQAKLLLSEQEQATITCRHEGKAVSATVTREQFEDITADLLQRTLDTAELVLVQAEVTAAQLDAVVLVGGSTQMPCVPRRLAEVLRCDPYRGLSPQTAVAQGAAIHAAILETKHLGSRSEHAEGLRKMLAKIRQENVNSHGLGVVVRDPKTGKEHNYVMIPRNTRLPIEAQQTLVTNYPGQQRAHVRVVQGEAPDPAACSLIGNCRIAELPEGLAKGSPIEVVYSFDEAGRVRVRAEDTTGGRGASIVIDRAGGLDEDQIDLYKILAEEYVVE